MVIDYLQTCDFLVFITEAALKKLIRDNDCKLLETEKMAYGYIYEKLSARYQIHQELSKNSEARNSAFVRWMTILAVYYLYQSVPDDDIPERVRINYEDVLKEIDRVAAGKDNCTLSPVLDSFGKPKTSFRWSSSPRRSHNPFG
jgi:hypothetical protein